jgi:molybdate transport system permease protein
MDWTALKLSVELALATVVVLVPLTVVLGRWLAYTAVRGKAAVEALVMLPLVLPPTVLGYYLLVGLGAASPLGKLWTALTGHPLVFSFAGLLAASVIFNLPLAVQPIQRAFEAIPDDVREAAACCGMRPWQAIRAVELPLAWPGILTAAVLTFAHTLGEFGVVLMVGGSIPGETRTIAISIYDRVQAFDDAAAARMSALLLAVSVAAISATFYLARRNRPARRPR